MSEVNELAAFELELQSLFKADPARPSGWNRLVEAMNYSLLQEGAKRFRPQLAVMTAKALQVNPKAVIPFACVVECIHTFSLIHDDLPAMDNDDYRRGKPTNHKRFDEGTAILAGDALLADAFGYLVSKYSYDPKLAVELVKAVSQATGRFGMIGGQAIDVSSERDSLSTDDLKNLHLLKTGELIRLAIMGSALICGATNAQKQGLEVFASSLGLAFQVADDLIDFHQGETGQASIAFQMGPENTKNLLKELSSKAVVAIENLGAASDDLKNLIQFNQERVF